LNKIEVAVEDSMFEKLYGSKFTLEQSYFRYILSSVEDHA
jgi:hypothetical protein